MDSISNVGVTAYINRSGQLFSMAEDIEVNTVCREYDIVEIIKVIGKRQANFFKMRLQSSTR